MHQLQDTKACRPHNVRSLRNSDLSWSSVRTLTHLEKSYVVADDGNVRQRMETTGGANILLSVKSPSVREAQRRACLPILNKYARLSADAGLTALSVSYLLAQAHIVPTRVRAPGRGRPGVVAARSTLPTEL